MALELKRIVYFNEAFKCDVTKKLLSYGDYYYEDTEDGLIIDAEYYHDRKMQNKMMEAMDEFHNAYNPEEYRIMLRESERRFMESTLMTRKVLKAQDLNLDKKDGDK